MSRTFRPVVLLGLFVLAGLAFPSVADAQRRGGNGGAGARGGPAVRTGGAVVRGGGYARGGHVAVPRTHYPSSYYRPYYAHSYYRPYYRPYYSGYYPRYYSPWSFSLSFGLGWYGGAYAPLYAYPSYPYPYAPAYPAYAYPYSSPAPYDTALSTTPSSAYDAQGRTTTAGADTRGEFGTLSIRVMPADATILIDREAWDRPRGDDRFSIELVEGSHHVEVRKAGYSTYSRTIDVPRGQSIVVNVALTPGGSGTMQVARTVPLRR